MCGISCILAVGGHTPTHISSNHACVNGNSTESKRKKLLQGLDQSLDQIKHRGPDSRGYWISQDNEVGTLVNLTWVTRLALTDMLLQRLVMYASLSTT